MEESNWFVSLPCPKITTKLPQNQKILWSLCIWWYLWFCLVVSLNSGARVGQHDQTRWTGNSTENEIVQVIGALNWTVKLDHCYHAVSRNIKNWVKNQESQLWLSFLHLIWSDPGIPEIPSEANINHPHWFSTQGIQFTRLTR